ncbi:response regulator [Marinobacter mobilis]|uniref:Two-component system, unclassified family, response regulator n=1 Tax=Marinobacter mobilis TaxID=488533 RepID=A0A1H2Y151_9GAMM|nr:response regulator [Marinobacter mobilis]SDW98877.1 two-component system, unclassified family, response regulator [Marinobacter mobilis]
MNPFPILLAEDDAMDRILTEEAFRESRLTNPLFFVNDGEELMGYLRRQPPYDDVCQYPMPGIILLDLNMPRMDGRACLREIRGDPELNHLPIVVLTTSTEQEEVVRSYNLGANSFMSKSIDFEAFVSQIKAFGDYWCSIVELPDGE